MYIPTAFRLLAASLLPCILAQDNKQAPVLAVPMKQIQGPIPQPVNYNKYIDTLEQEFTTHMSAHKLSMKSHLESLAEILGMELDVTTGTDLEELLSTVVLVLGDVEIEQQSTHRYEGRGGTTKARGGSDSAPASRGDVRGGVDAGSGGSEKERKKRPNIGDRQDVEEKLETFVTAMGIVSEMKEQHLALNLWLVGIREKIHVLKRESARG